MASYGGKREGAGRKKKQSTMLAEKARDEIAKRLKEELPEILNKAIEQAKQGDYKAREWLSERAWGKVSQTINTEDDEGNKMPILANVLSNNSNAKGNGAAEEDTSGSRGNVSE